MPHEGLFSMRMPAGRCPTCSASPALEAACRGESATGGAASSLAAAACKSGCLGSGGTAAAALGAFPGFGAAYMNSSMVREGRNAARRLRVAVLQSSMQTQQVKHVEESQ